MEYKKNQEVYIRDFYYGKPTRIKGTVVGILKNGFFNIKMLNGLDEGKIKRYSEFQITNMNYEEFIEYLEKEGV